MNLFLRIGFVLFGLQSLLWDGYLGLRLNSYGSLPLSQLFVILLTGVVILLLCLFVAHNLKPVGVNNRTWRICFSVLTILLALTSVAPLTQSGSMAEPYPSMLFMGVLSKNILLILLMLLAIYKSPKTTPNTDPSIFGDNHD